MNVTGITRSRCALGAGFLLLVSCDAVAPATTTVAELGMSGAQLYQRFCAACHGAHGRGDGLPAGVLEPPARDFGKGRFSLVSTDNGNPTDADLDRLLVRGMPGSAMPSFAWLAPADRQRVLAYVRGLTEAARAEALVERAGKDGLDPATALQRARAELRPGTPIAEPDASADPVALAQRGAQLYAKHCALCHDEQGTGRRPVAQGDGKLVVRWARDFTSGVLRGGSSPRDLASRIVAGMPASAMPPTEGLSDRDLAALVAHVRKLILPGSEHRLVQQRSVVVAKRVAKVDAASDEQWAGIEEVPVVLSPLRWDADAILHARLQAMHDGARVAVRVSWKDPTCDAPAPGQAGRGDGVALQWSGEREPTFFGMGSLRAPVNIWYWRTHTFKERAGLLDLVSRSPHQLDVPPRIAAPGVTGFSDRAASVISRGHVSAAGFGRQDRGVAVLPRWENGEWVVAFTRALVSSEDGEIQLSPGLEVKLALALWNGSIGAPGRQKTFTIWHALRLAR